MHDRTSKSLRNDREWTHFLITMHRRSGIALLCLLLLSGAGCKTTRSSTQTPQNPFYGQTTVPPPGTGSYLGQGPSTVPSLPNANPSGASVYAPSAPPASNPASQPPDSLFGYNGDPAGAYQPPTPPPSGVNPSGNGNATYGGSGGNPASTWSPNPNTASPTYSDSGHGTSSPNSTGNYGNYNFPEDRYAPGNTGGGTGYERSAPNRFQPGGNPGSPPGATYPGGQTYPTPPGTAPQQPSSYPNSTSVPQGGPATSNPPRGTTNPYLNTSSSSGSDYDTTSSNTSTYGSSFRWDGEEQGDQIEIPLSARRSTTAEQAHSEFTSTFDSDIWSNEGETPSPAGPGTSERSESLVAASSEHQTVVRGNEPSPVQAGVQQQYGNPVESRPVATPSGGGTSETESSSGANQPPRKVDLRDLQPTTSRRSRSCPRNVVVACSEIPVCRGEACDSGVLVVPSSCSAIPCRPISPCGGSVLYYH